MPLFLLGIFFTSCSKDDVTDDAGDRTEEVEQTVETRNLEIEDFVWKAMNNIYLYKSEVPELGDTYFKTQADLNKYLLKYDSPEDLFYNGLVSDKDNFSWIVDDYEEHENYLQGSSKSAGFRYGFTYVPGSTSKVMAYVIFISPNGPADAAGLKRGDFITEVNGIEITLNNYQGIFNSDNLTLGISTKEDGFLVKSEDAITVNKSVFKEKPIAVDKVFTVEGVKIGYIYLSTFLGEYGIDDAKLNDVFGKFKSENIDELIVDLRYNSGGYSDFSTDMASMVTGQFEGKVFTQMIWNKDWLDYWDKYNREFLFNRMDGKISNGQDINSLNLNRVYVIETDRSYSASESFLIGLEPYIEVIHVGLKTGGKYQGSYTIYDSEGFFSKKNINPNHKYALQPLVYKYANSVGFTDFPDGLIPDIEIDEDPDNLGQLGELDEPLLARTIAAITGNSSSLALQKRANEQKIIFDKLPTEDGKGLFISSNPFEEDLPVDFPGAKLKN